MCAATPDELIPLGSVELGPIVGVPQSGIEQRNPTSAARRSRTASLKLSRCFLASAGSDIRTAYAQRLTGPSSPVLRPLRELIVTVGAYGRGHEQVDRLPQRSPGPGPGSTRSKLQRRRER